MTLTKTTKIMHGIVALGMISLIAVGLYMSKTETFSLYSIHKSFGMIVLIFALYRIINRIREGWPTPVGTASAIQLLAAKLVHWGLIISTVLYPISGMMMSGAGGRGLYVFGIELLAMNKDAVTGKVVPLNGDIASLGHTLHEGLVWIVIGLIIAHVVGALKHHFVDKDETVKRMFSK